MKVIAFDAGTINERGTSVAVFDYADHLERTGLGRALVLHDAGGAGSSPGAVARFRERFELVERPAEQDLPDFLARRNATVLYRLKAGADDGRHVPGVRNANHVVFRHDEPHGDRYAYISEWLTQHMTEGLRPWVRTSSRCPNLAARSAANRAFLHRRRCSADMEASISSICPSRPEPSPARWKCARISGSFS